MLGAHHEKAMIDGQPRVSAAFVGIIMQQPVVHGALGTSEGIESGFFHQFETLELYVGAIDDL